MAGSDLFTGSLDLLILKATSWGPLHGYAIGRWIRQSTEGYDRLRPHVAYVQIKDALAATGEVVPAGEGDGEVRETIRALRADGFDGFFSMEPHLAVVHHDPAITSPAAIRHANYVEYGRRFAALLAGVKGEIVRERAATAPG